MIVFLSIFGRFWDPKSVKDRSKIDPKGDRKQDASWDGFWMALGTILERFWAQVGAQVGAKLAPKSKEMGYQDNIKKSSKIMSCGEPQVDASQPPWAYNIPDQEGPGG